MAKRYIYFVSYWIDAYDSSKEEYIMQGPYNGEVSCNSVLYTIDQVNEVEEAIRKTHSHTRSVTIIYYKLLREENIEED